MHVCIYHVHVGVGGEWDVRCGMWGLVTACPCLACFVCMYVCVYIYIERERESLCMYSALL